MKKNFRYSFLLIPLLLMAIGIFDCSHGHKTSKIKTSDSTNTSNGNTIDSDLIKKDTLGRFIEIGTLSDKDQWLRVNRSELSTQAKRLVDAYNAAVVLNSVITDFDLQMRDYLVDDVVEAIKSIDITRVQDQEVRTKLKAYKK